MNIDLLLNAEPVIQVHVWSAFLAIVVGLGQFLLPRGRKLHRMNGQLWVALMAVTALSSFLIHRIQLVGLWSPVHLLSIYTLVMLVFSVRVLSHGNRKAHGTMMGSLFVFGLIGAGIFTLLPGRLMHGVVFG